MAVSKGVIRRERSTQQVKQAAEVHAAAAGEGLATLFAPLVQPGEQMPDWRYVLVLLARALDTTLAALVAADAAHHAELADDREPRNRRDDATERLYTVLVEIRTLVTALLGTKAAEQAGFSGATPQDPRAMSTLAAAVDARLADVVARFPGRRGLTLDAAELRADLAEPRATLDAALADVAREAREADATQASKTAALAAHDERFGTVAGLVAGLLALAGRPELAARVRPSSRKAGRTEAEADEADESEQDRVPVEV